MRLAAARHTPAGVASVGKSVMDAGQLETHVPVRRVNAPGKSLGEALGLTPLQWYHQAVKSVVASMALEGQPVDADEIMRRVPPPAHEAVFGPPEA